MPGGARFTTLNAKQTKLEIQGVVPGSYVLVAATSDQGRSYLGQMDHRCDRPGHLGYFHSAASRL